MERKPQPGPAAGVAGPSLHSSSGTQAAGRGQKEQGAREGHGSHRVFRNENVKIDEPLSVP